MDRRQLLKTLSIGGAGLALVGTGLAVITGPAKEKKAVANSEINNDGDKYTAYLMAHFMSSDQNLYYAYSRDGRNWTALNERYPVFKPGVNLRDPFIGRAKGKFHLVHTQGWDYPVIHHYVSGNLIDWEGGPIQVVAPALKRAWAPEWYYEASEDLFYVYWASINKEYNSIFYTTTRDWKDILPENSKLFYDLGKDDIDLTIVKKDSQYYGFHKPGSLKDNESIGVMRSPTLNPNHQDFGFGKKSSRQITTEVIKPIEGPEVLQLIGQQKWYLYADPFYNDFIAWETSDFEHFTRIAISVPHGAKHCSMLPVTEDELAALLDRYPV